MYDYSQRRVYDLRKVSWGMRQAEVKTAETAEAFGEPSPTQLSYFDTLVGLECAIFYNFTNSELTKAVYIIINNEDYLTIQAYEKIDNLLTKKHGESENKGLSWQDGIRRRPQKTYGEIANAVANGDVEYYAGWATDRTDVFLVLCKAADEYRVIVKLDYSSVDLHRIATDMEFENDIDLL